MRKIILLLMLVTGIGYFAHAQDSTKVKKAPEDHATKESRSLQKKLNLTDDQTKQVATIMADRDGKIAAYRGVPNSKGQVQQLRDDANKQIEAILTKDQRKQFVEMELSQKEKANSTKFLLPTDPKSKKGF